MTKTYRVVAWSTGNVGVHVIAGIDARPDLELVGLWVSNPDKVGKDAGDLAGLGRTLGVAATDDVEAAARPQARRGRAHRHGRPPADGGARRPAAPPPGRGQRGLQRPGVPAVPLRRGRRLDDRPGARGRPRRRGVPLRQRGRPRLRQRRPAPGADRGQRADRRAAGVRDPQLRHLQPAHGHLRHHGLRAAPRRRPHDPPARGADHGLGQRGAPAGRRARRRARLGRGVVRAACRRPRPSRSTRAPSSRAPPPPSTSRCAGIRNGRAVIVLEHVTRLHDDLAPDWPQPAGHGCYRVQVSGEPNYTLDLQLLGSDGDHNTAGLKATAMRLVNAIPAVVDAGPGPAHRPRPAAGLRTGPGQLSATVRSDPREPGAGRGRAAGMGRTGAGRTVGSEA